MKGIMFSKSEGVGWRTEQFCIERKAHLMIHTESDREGIRSSTTLKKCDEKSCFTEISKKIAKKVDAFLKGKLKDM